MPLTVGCRRCPLSESERFWDETFTSLREFRLIFSSLFRELFGRWRPDGAARSGGLFAGALTTPATRTGESPFFPSCRLGERDRGKLSTLPSQPVQPSPASLSHALFLPPRSAILIPKSIKRKDLPVQSVECANLFSFRLPLLFFAD